MAHGRLPPPDPWLNRQMRLKAGLLLPERRIGLSAHDFQQAIAAPEVVLTRARRDAEAETVPSRWLNRLMNLLQGLPDQGGRVALGDEGARRSLAGHGGGLERPDMVPPAPRPAPRPPVAARPRELAVTGIRNPDPRSLCDLCAPCPAAARAGSAAAQADARLARVGAAQGAGGLRPGRPDANPPPPRLHDVATRAGCEVPWPAARAVWQQRGWPAWPTGSDLRGALGARPW
jgi:ATP-dependent helicase/nuclease subunit B